MSKETAEHLNTQTLIGYTAKRGNAWHYREDLQGAEPNHYEGAIPVEDVRRRLFNWEPVEGPVQTVVEIGGQEVTIVDPCRKTVIRPDTRAILGLFKQGYRMHGYDQWLISNVESILDADLAIGSAGLLRAGAQAWVQVEMADTINVAGVDFRPFLTAGTSLDGSLATTYFTGAQVVVCDNTYSIANREATAKYKVKHSKNSLGKLETAREALGVVYGTADAFAAEVKALTEQAVTDKQWADFTKAYCELDKELEKAALTRAENKRGELNRLWNYDERVSPWKNTAFGVVQAANTYAHHIMPVRGMSRADRNMDKMINGGFDAVNAEALATLALVTA